MSNVKMIKISDNHIKNMKRRFTELRDSFENINNKQCELFDSLEEDLELCVNMELDDNLL